MYTLVSLTALLLTSSYVQAAPAIGRRDISPALLTQLEYLSEYSGAAYCTDNNVPNSPSLVTCDVGNCPAVQASGATTVLEYQNVGPVDATGFVAIDNSKQLIVLAFRGSKSISNWLANVNIAQKPFAACSGCTAHAGFLDTWNAVSRNIITTLAAATKQYPSYRIIATGHSLGGAVAVLAAGDLRKAGYNVDLYTYGAPMTGNVALVNYISSKNENYRVTHAYDIVPKLPSYLLGYAHISDEYWITSASGVAVTAADIKVSSGALNLKGNAGQIKSNPDDHQFYFGNITACGSQTLEFP